MNGEQSAGAELREIKETLIKVVQSHAEQREMIRKILQAVTERADDASPLADILERLAAADRDNQALLHQIVDGLERIEHRLKPASPRFVPTEPWYPPIGRRLGSSCR
jgi:uncharacterized membrane-anchored protein YjiN (DUF445 family)